MLSKQKIDSILNTNGISDYKWIKPEKIVVAQWVRVKCMFGCKHYGTGSCPPNAPSVNECDRFFKEYKNAI
jgi:predicted metal-binding protein